MGAAIVEFAIVANVMILIVFICIEFTRLNMMRNLTQDAAYFAARTAMVPGGTEADAITEANRVLGIMNTQNATITVNDGGGLTTDSREIHVTVSVPISDNALFVPMFTGDKTLEATASMRTERYDGFYNGTE
ncbi:TadE-like protein [Roseimaritima multifibrata]|uniref:TadE-like protein n=2 Tax=Roseimaritima multifibrata TaxID=1930274 RepID=A0A517MBP3_9BACT|nr:TadE-like protein [Roseimaritima multifibrata]